MTLICYQEYLSLFCSLSLWLRSVEVTTTLLFVLIDSLPHFPADNGIEFVLPAHTAGGTCPPLLLKVGRCGTMVTPREYRKPLAKNNFGTWVSCGITAGPRK